MCRARVSARAGLKPNLLLTQMDRLSLSDQLGEKQNQEKEIIQQLERACRLVEQQNGRPPHQRPGDREALPLAVPRGPPSGFWTAVCREAPHAPALLRACRERPSHRRAAERSDEFAPSKAHQLLPVRGPEARACGPCLWEDGEAGLWGFDLDPFGVRCASCEAGPSRVRRARLLSVAPRSPTVSTATAAFGLAAILLAASRHRRARRSRRRAQAREAHRPRHRYSSQGGRRTAHPASRHGGARQVRDRPTRRAALRWRRPTAR